MVTQDPSTYAERMIESLFGPSDIALCVSLELYLQKEVTEQKKLPYIEAMKALGFPGFEQLKDHSQVLNDLGYDREILLKQLKYRLAYPLCRPFTDEIRDAICAKYNLVIGKSTDYQGPIPLWAMKQILQTKILQQDGVFVHSYPTLEQVGERLNADGIKYPKGTGKKDRRARRELNDVLHKKEGLIQLSPKPIMVGNMRIERAGLLVMAPLSAFNTTGKTVVRNFLTSFSSDSIEKQIEGMTFEQVITFFDNQPYLGLTSIEAAQKFFNVRTQISTMSYEEVIDYYVHNPQLIPHEEDLNAEGYTIKTVGPCVLKKRFGSLLKLTNYLKSGSGLVPRGKEIGGYAWTVWDPIIYLPVQSANLAFVAFGGDEAYDPSIYSDIN